MGRIDVQNKLGKELASLLKVRGWEPDTVNPAIYGFSKIQGSTVWGIGFNLSGRSNYSIFSIQDVSFIDLGRGLQKLLCPEIPESLIRVGIVGRSVDLSQIKIFESTDIPIAAKLMSELYFLEEERFFLENSNEEDVLKRNMNKMHWKWPSQPYLQYVLFMAGYALKNNDPSKILLARNKVSEIRQEVQSRPGEMEIVDRIFKRLTECGLLP